MIPTMIFCSTVTAEHMTFDEYEAATGRLIEGVSGQRGSMLTHSDGRSEWYPNDFLASRLRVLDSET